MKRTKILLSFVLILLVTAGTVFATGGQQPAGGAASSAPVAPGGTLPRNQTLYYNGILWNTPTQFNPYGTGGTTFGIAAGNQARQMIYETLFLYNMLDGKMYPHIAESWSWATTYNIRIVLRRDVHFNNGQPLTAADVANSWTIHREYQTSSSGDWTANYLLDVVAVDNYTVEIRGNPQRFNPVAMTDSLCSRYITSKAEWDRILQQTDPGRGTATSDRLAVGRWANLDPVATGAYKPYFWDDTRCVLLRDDNYWGKSKYGRLPEPRYIAHAIYRDNPAGDAAFAANQVDVSQQFISNVWTMWERGLPIETYIPQPPYYFPGVIPTLIYNTQRPGLNEAVVRKAINYSLDYPTMAQNAASGYSAAVVSSYMVPIPQENALVDWDQLRQYQWSDNRTDRIAQANRELDAAGWVRGTDGVRAKGGVRLAFTAICPTGWTDFQATLEVVAQSARDVGISIVTEFPTSQVVTERRENGNFDINLNNIGGVGPNNPWGRFNQAFNYTQLPPVGTTNNIGNWGRWTYPGLDDILVELTTANDARKKELYTRLNIIFLQEHPVGVAWYRPVFFHTVNTSTWIGFPRMNDATNVPPTLLSDGYGYMGMFNIRAR